MLARAARAAVCYDDHDRGEAFVVSQCGHVLCRDAARSVALAATQCAHSSGGGRRPVQKPPCAPHTNVGAWKYHPFWMTDSSRKSFSSAR